MTATVLLADDHPLVRRGLKSLLEAEAGFTVVGEGEDGLQVIQLVEKLRQDILVVDLMMPNLNGLEVLRQVHRRFPATRMVVLSMQSADPYVLEAFRAGAMGYVLKDSAPQELITAIQYSLLDVRYLSPNLPVRLGDLLTQLPGRPEHDPYENLTDREREVFQMASEGKTASDIARILSISPRTAEIHRSRMMDKLGLHSQTELVHYAEKRGILPLDE